MSRKPAAALSPATKKVRPLTRKQELFVAEYRKDLNATAAAKRAGYHPKMAAQLLAIPSIRMAVAEKTKQQLAKADLTAERVLEEIRRVCFANMGDFLDDDGAPKLLSTLSPEQKAALVSLEVVIKNTEAGDGHQDKVYKIRLHDKLKALELAMKHLRLLEPEGQPAVVLQQLVIRIQEVPAGAQVPLSPQKALQ